MRELTDILSAATAAINPAYFWLSIAGGPAIYRERVYCYELYHQMRSLWPHPCAYWLNGEVDKRAHPILSQLGAAKHVPDLLVHIPGDMNGNHAIIEVKPASVQTRYMKKDLSTLLKFLRDVGYERAIYLIYGPRDSEQLIRTVRTVLGNMPHPPGDHPAIELWQHTGAGEPARLISRL